MEKLFKGAKTVIKQQKILKIFLYKWVQMRKLWDGAFSASWQVLVRTFSRMKRQ
jgi:hypothetical protein